MAYNYLHPVYLYARLQVRPDTSKRGYRQKYLHGTMFPTRDFQERHILLTRSAAENNLAGLFDSKGKALPVGDLGFEEMMLSLQDIKSARQVDPELIKTINKLNELENMQAGNSLSAGEMKSKVQAEIDRKLALCQDDVDSLLEYFAIQALSTGQIIWPPTDNAGNAITPAPPHWNAAYAGTWTFPLPADLNQTITALVDKDGNAAPAAQQTVWSDADADIIGALNTLHIICQEKYAFSLEGGTIHMRTTMLEHIANNAAIRDILLGDTKEQTGARNFVSRKAVREFVQTELGFQIATYDSFWTYQTQVQGEAPTTSTVHFLPEERVFIVPAGGIEGANMGTAPIEDANENWSPGMMVWFYKEPKPPYEREFGVNMIAWPVIQYYEWVALDALN